MISIEEDTNAQERFNKMLGADEMEEFIVDFTENDFLASHYLVIGISIGSEPLEMFNEGEVVVNLVKLSSN